MLFRFAVVGALATLSLPAQAPGGYKTYENKLAPISFFYPRVYKEVPLPPTEQTLVARFVMEDKPRELRKVDDRVYKAVEPALYFFCFTEAAARTGGRGSAEEKEGGPETAREAMEERSRVASWEEFCKRFGKWDLTEDRRKPGEFKLRFTGDWPLRDVEPIGRLIRKEEGGTVFGVYGYALSPYERTFDRQFDKMVKGLELSEDDAGERASEKIDRIYASGEYSNVEQRKQARAELARGWKAYDTPNYLIVHHSKRPALVERLGRDIEAMRGLYMELFPPTKEMDRLAIVRVCQTKEEYSQYGGPPGSGGYWHSGNEELVFYDYSYTQKTLTEEEKERMGGRRLTDDDSFLVLYHEAFHQYIHYAVGEFAPHDWYNEGHGDFFSGTVIGKRTGKIDEVGPSPWRIHVAKDMCENGKGFVKLEKILNAERAEFYNRSRIGYYYAGAWSFVYFLRMSEKAKTHAQWSKMLQVYFDVSKTVYAEELARLGETPGLREKKIAQFNTRKRALEACLEGIDLRELEAAWKEFVIEMRDPWPARRKGRK